MTSFFYKARDRYGVLVSGHLEVENSKQAAWQLSQQGYTPLAITTDEPSDFFRRLESWLAYLQPLKIEELVVFTRQLASTLDAGIPLTSGLEAVAEQLKDKKFRRVVLALIREIERGSTFSDAMEKHPAAFSALFVNMVRAGERAGILPAVLDRLSNIMEKDLETTAKVKTATRYPLIVLITLSIAFFILTLYVIPRFAAFFATFKTQLPLPTRLLMSLSQGLIHFWYWLLGLIALAIYLFRKVLQTERGRYNWDSFVLSTPIFGPLFSKIYLSRFSRMLSAMIGSGIPILEALTITSNTSENKVISRVILAVRNQVAQGKNLTEPMKGSQIFPAIATEMVAIGEKAGNLEQMLNKTADYFEREIDYSIKNLAPVLEPLLILGLALVVLLFALGIFLPMWDLIKIYKT